MPARIARPVLHAPEQDLLPRQPRASISAWWTLSVLYVFHIFSFIDRQIITMLVNPIKADLGLSDTEISIILGPAFIISYALLGIPLGWVSDRAPRRLVLYVCVTVWSLSAAAGGLARSFVQLVVARVGVGAAEAGLAPSAYTILGDAFPRERLAFAMGIYQSANMVGTALAYIIGGFLIYYAGLFIEQHAFLHGVASWHIVLIATGLPGVVIALLAFTIPREVARRSTAKSPTGRSELKDFLLTNARPLSCLMLGFGSICCAAMAMQAWVPAFMERQYGLLPIQFGPWLSLVSVAAALSMPVKGFIIDMLYARGRRDIHVRFYTWLAFLALPAVAIVFWLPSPTAFIIVYACLQVTAFTFMVYLIPVLQIFTPPALKGQVTGAFLVTFAIVGALGPVMVGVINDAVFQDPNRIGAALSIVATTAVLVGLLTLRISLPYLQRFLDSQEAANGE